MQSLVKVFISGVARILESGDLAYHVVFPRIQESGLRNYNLTWNAKNTGTGIYFIRLNTPNFTQTERVTLIK